MYLAADIIPPLGLDFVRVPQQRAGNQPGFETPKKNSNEIHSVSIKAIARRLLLLGSCTET